MAGDATPKGAQAVRPRRHRGAWAPAPDRHLDSGRCIALTLRLTVRLPSGSPSGAALPGDPTNGQSVYQQHCTTCHGSNLEGSIGPALNPIAHLPGVTNPLDPTYLIDTITNGRKPASGAQMPAWKGQIADKDIQDVAAFIIQQNKIGTENVPLPQGELAKRTIFWVGVGIIAMVFVTYLLAQYNMRWIARRAAARRR